MRETLKLYRVTCRGMKSSATGPAHGIAYVVATGPTEAYATLRQSLDVRDLGFPKDRELETVELIAESTPHPECGCQLYAARAAQEVGE